jgi:phosphoglycerate dehydrogenase-like enzyme
MCEVVNVVINKILISSRLNNELINKLNMDAEVIYVDFNELDNKCFEKADAFIGFELPQNIDASQLKWIHSLGAGVDNIINNKTLSGNTIITRTPGNLGNKISEYVLCRILLESQKVREYDNNQKLKKWYKEIPRSIENERVLIFGTGNIGSTVARLLNLLRVSTVGISKNGNQKNFFENIYKSVDDISDIKNITWIINTMPLTPETTGYFNYSLFSKFESANFINVGRGVSVVTEDFLQALIHGHINSAYLDVFDNEPLDKDSCLWSNPRVHITPHIAAFTDITEAVQAIKDTYANIIEGKHLDNQVNIELGY